MLEQIKDILKAEGITRVGMLDINECEIINARLMPEWAKSVIMFCIPYRSDTEIPKDGFSEYSRIYDYHKFSTSLFERTIDKMRNTTGYQFKGFCDHSPINEKLAVAKCSLGVIGRNSLFIDNIYGSFVFLGTIVTDATSECSSHDIELCENCGFCITACPNSAILENGIDRFKCLSGISQKKSKTKSEKEILKMHNIVWGCDICQLVCPHNAKAEISPVPYFKETRIKHIDKEFIKLLSDEEFNKYAFAYKGRKIIIDNIEFI